jgi:hypothetical protein
MRFDRLTNWNIKSSARRDGALALLAAFLLAGVLSGCASKNGATPEDASAQADGSAQAQQPPSRRRRVRLHTRSEQVDLPLPRGASMLVRASGPVSVLEGDLETMLVRSQVSALTEERLGATRVSVALDGAGRLVIEAEWPDGRKDGEVASFEVRVPRGARHLEVSTIGAVTLSGMHTDSVITTQNGAVTVADHHAGVHASTTNAQMSFERVDGVIKAETTNAIVLVREARGPVSVQTSRAAIDIRMATDAVGPVRATTELGAIALRIGPAFAGTLTMRTSDAPIAVEMKSGAGEVLSRKIDETVIRFGNDSTPSSLVTSGGTIELRVQER